MFKNLILYRIAATWVPDAAAVAEALSKAPFTECTPTQTSAAGWVPPRGIENGALLESVGGQWLLKLCTERKAVPTAIVQRRADEMAAQIEQQTGRKPGKKQRKELKEDALHELLPQAFPKRTTVPIWIDPARRLLAVDATSLARADEVVTGLVRSLDGLALTLLASAEAPTSVMSAWLAGQEPPEYLTVDRECELRSTDEMKAAVRYTRYTLEIDEVREHIRAGKVAERLALTWAGRVSFVLGSNLQLRKLKFLDVVFEGRGRTDNEDAFDADAAIATGELARLVPDLLHALGGEYVAPIEAEAPPAASTSAQETDPLLAQARDLVRAHQRASISFVQRHLRIGYNRAARLLEALEAQRVVTPMNREGHRDLVAA